MDEKNKISNFSKTVNLTGTKMVPMDSLTSKTYTQTPKLWFQGNQLQRYDDIHLRMCRFRNASRMTVPMNKRKNGIVSPSLFTVNIQNCIIDISRLRKKVVSFCHGGVHGNPFWLAAYNCEGEKPVTNNEGSVE